MIILSWYSKGTKAPRTTNTALRASNAPAQRGRTWARNVAIPNSSGPKLNMGPELVHNIGRSPRSTVLGAPLNIPIHAAINAGDTVASFGRIKASTKEKPHV